MSIASNKKAFHDYFILEKFEAGIELKGTEVKSVKLGKTSIKESFVRPIKGEIFIMGMHIKNYEYGNIHNVEETRVRKLLLHKKEIDKLIGKTSKEGLTIVPLKVFITRGLVKIQIALAKGKKVHDKRDTLKKREQTREIEKEFKNFQR